MTTTLTEAYRQLGYKITNPRNQWSAINEDGGVAITIWEDEISKAQEPWTVDNRAHPKFHLWGHKVGNKSRARHLAKAMENGGSVDLILCVAHDPSEEPRRIKDRRPLRSREGKVTDFDPLTGQFRLELRKR